MANIELCLRTMLDYSAKHIKTEALAPRHVSLYYQQAHEKATSDIERRKVGGGERRGRGSRPYAPFPAETTEAIGGSRLGRSCACPCYG